MSTASREAALAERSARPLAARLAPALRRSWPAYLLLLPFLVHFAVVVAYPFFYSIYLSFFQAGLNEEPTFIGLANYARLLGDAEFRQALIGTIDLSVQAVQQLGDVGAGHGFVGLQHEQPLAFGIEDGSLPLRLVVLAAEGFCP